jgi:hypothetical protein
MSKQKNHIAGLNDRLMEYAEKRMLDFHQYSPYHMRMMDGGFVVADFWTTGRYYIVMTDYQEMLDGNVVERQGEKGQLPLEDLWPFLDTLFYGDDMSDHTDIK